MKKKMNSFLCVNIIIILLTGYNGAEVENGLFSTDYNSDSTSEEPEWNGKWFPQKPGSPDTLLQMSSVPMGIPNSECDDGKTGLSMDFDAKNLTQNEVYLCCESINIYMPRNDVEPIITEVKVPPAYVAMHKCMNEPIIYDERLPTFGTHRPIWPIYGEYLYLPPQRWLHSLEHGGLVALYHPCANGAQVNKLRMLVKNCLRRHIISPSKLLLPSRPFALLTWGRRMEFSVVDETTVKNFIRENALHGPEAIAKDGLYDQFLVEQAKNVTGFEDDVLCPKLESGRLM